MLNVKYHNFSESAKIPYFLASMLIHFLILSVIQISESSLKPSANKDITLYIQPQEEKILVPDTKQYVSPSEMKETLITPKTPFLSDKNTQTEKQQIKRGTVEKPSVINKKDLKENNDKNILERISKSTLSALKNDINSLKDNEKQNLKVLEKNLSESEERINSLAAGIQGNPDLVKGIPDGEITLLNAKADRFAVFVRRVALQVFSALRTSNWHEIGNIAPGFQTGEVTIRAILDKNGKLLKTELLESSKIPLFDSVLSNSVKKGAWDRNPPPSALATDGNIRFIFKSKSWVKGGAGGRSQQWILLATGLE